MNDRNLLFDDVDRESPFPKGPQGQKASKQRVKNEASWQHLPPLPKVVADDITALRPPRDPTIRMRPRASSWSVDDEPPSEPPADDIEPIDPDKLMRELTLPLAKDWQQATKDDPELEPLLAFVQQRDGGAWTHGRKAAEARLTGKLGADFARFQQDYYLDRYGRLCRKVYDVNNRRLPKANHVLIVPKKFQLQLAGALHALRGVGTHYGPRPIEHEAREILLWPTMHADIVKVCRNCKRCIVSDKRRFQRTTRLQPMSATRPGERLHIDHQVQLPMTKHGNSCLLVVVDAFSRFSEAFPVKDQSGVTTANVLWKQWFNRYGCPESIVTDRHQNFQSELFTTLTRLMGIEQRRTCPYSPQSNGMAERFNATIKQISKRYAEAIKNHKNWDETMCCAVHAYNTTKHSSTGYSPFEVFFGRRAVSPLDQLLDIDLAQIKMTRSVREYIAQIVDSYRLVWQLTREADNERCERNRKYYDRKVRPTDPITIGDHVVLRRDSIQAKEGTTRKFMPYQYGPYEVVGFPRDDPRTVRIRCLGDPTNLTRVERRDFVLKVEKDWPVVEDDAPLPMPGPGRRMKA